MTTPQKSNDCLVTSDPYQWFFPFGVFLGMLGTALWVFFPDHGISFYPGIIHAEFMMGGFFLMVAVGFLMTAIPRFTGTSSASVTEKILPLLPWALVAAPLRLDAGLRLIALLEFLLLMAYGGRRLRKSRNYPPPSFILIGFGLFSGLLGSSLLFLREVVLINPQLAQLGHLLFYYGMFYSLVLGVGSRLIPLLMGTAAPANPQLPTPLNSTAGQFKQYRVFALYGILLLATFLLEAFGSPRIGEGIRNLLVTGVVVGHWRIYRRPTQGNLMALCLWICSYMLILGGWVAFVFPSLRVHGLHIVFIGALSLMIFSVATRVVVAHGGHDSRLESRSKALWVCLVALLLAAAGRMAAPLTQDYFSHLSYAALLWILGAGAWMAGFFPKILKRRKH